MKDPVLIYLEGGAQRMDGGPADLRVLVRDQPELLDRVVVHLSGPDARVRGGAAGLLAQVAAESPALVVRFVPDLVQALEHEELPTRIGAWRAIASAAAFRPGVIEDDFDTVRLGLFDPLHPEIRAQAAQAVARYGTRDPESARRAFPHLAEALRRFHDGQRPADLIGSLVLLAGGTGDEKLRKDIWRAVRRHEKHPDPSVRNGVEEIGRLSRDVVNQNEN